MQGLRGPGEAERARAVAARPTWARRMLPGQAMRTSLVLVACSVVAGCSQPARSPAPAPGAPQADRGSAKPLGQAVLETHARMHQRYVATHLIHQALALSDLGLARRQAQVVADLDEPDALPQWQPYVAEIRAAARQVVAAEDPVVAAAQLAQLGRSCARCHVAMDAKIAFASEPRPPADEQLRSTMQSHHWAASRMWEGLFAPSNDRWQEGARTLEAAPLTITAELGEPPGELGIANDVARIRLLARRALETDQLDARATLYGELLGTCVGCHHVIRDR